MYIIAKNKDYYDGVVGTVGIDKTIVYERTIVGLAHQDFPEPFKSDRTMWKDTNPFTSLNFKINSEKYEEGYFFIVGFCGKLYLGWRFLYKEKEFDYDTNHLHDVEKYDIIYGYENAKEHLKGSWSWSKLHNENKIKYILNYDPINIFRKINAPIFVFSTNGTGIVRYYDDRDKPFIINPILKEYEFYKVIDAFTAFTELQMFISGVLGTGEKEIIEVADKYKIMQHGFDYKWSFRKKPEQKKNLKQENKG